jgi:hypothetical protein
MGFTRKTAVDTQRGLQVRRHGVSTAAQLTTWVTTAVAANNPRLKEKTILAASQPPFWVHQRSLKPASESVSPA